MFSIELERDCEVAAVSFAVSRCTPRQQCPESIAELGKI